MSETQLSWVKCLPLALLKIWTQPRTDIGIWQLEMLYGMPYDMDSPIDHPEINNQQINQYVMQLMKAWEGLRRAELLVQWPPLDLAIHNIKPSDKVFIKTWKETSLTPNWEGPCVVLLTTETAVRTTKKGWTHASRIKGPITAAAEGPWRITSQPGDLKVTFKLT